MINLIAPVRCGWIKKRIDSIIDITLNAGITTRSSKNYVGLVVIDSRHIGKRPSKTSHDPVVGVIIIIIVVVVIIINNIVVVVIVIVIIAAADVLNIEQSGSGAKKLVDKVFILVVFRNQASKIF